MSEGRVGGLENIIHLCKWLSKFVFLNLWDQTNSCLFYLFFFVFLGFLSSSQQNGIWLFAPHVTILQIDENAKRQVHLSSGTEFSAVRSLVLGRILGK